MKIRTRLTLISCISLVVTLLVISFLAWSFSEVSKIDQTLDLVQKMRKNAFERTMLRDEYLLNHGQRALIQWNLKTEELRKLLKLTSDRLTQKNERALLIELNKYVEITTYYFYKIVKLHKDKFIEQSKFDIVELEKRLFSQLLLKAYALQVATNRMEELFKKKSDAMHTQVFYYIIIIVTAAFIATITNSLVVNRIVKRRIEILFNGIHIIGSGNLDYRIEVKGEDELSSLAHLSNEMAGKLQKSFTSIENLQKEIAERQRAEVETHRQSAIVEAFNRVLIETLKCDSYEEVACTGLKVIQRLTGSKFGWIGEVNPSGHLDTLALSDPDWHPPRIAETPGVMTIRNMETPGIWSRVVQDGTSLIINDPAAPSGQMGVPCGHPELTALLGAPLRHADKTFGMIVLANKPSGYARHDQEAVETISVALVEALRRKRAEEEIRALNLELEQRVRERTAQLEAANRELEVFSYSVSHDLRAPLRGIDGWTLAFLEDFAPQLDDLGRQYLNRVRTETQHMGRLIDDMLSLSRVSRAEIQRQPVDLTALARAIASRLRETGPERRVEFVIQDGLSAEGDPRLLEIALLNLLDNAWKFTGKRASAVIEFGQARPGRGTRFLCPG